MLNRSPANTDLLHTVSDRYARGAGFHNLFTLSYRLRERRNEQKELFARQMLEKSILQTAGRDMLRHTEQWRRQLQSTEMRWLNASRREKRQAELFAAAVERKIKDERRRTDERLTKNAEELREETRRLAHRNMRETRLRIRREAEYESRRRG